MDMEPHNCFQVHQCALLYGRCGGPKGRHRKIRFGEAIRFAMDRFSDIEAERHRDDSLQPQATPSQSSSSERSETLSSEEKSLDN